MLVRDFFLENWLVLLNLDVLLWQVLNFVMFTMMFMMNDRLLDNFLRVMCWLMDFLLNDFFLFDDSLLVMNMKRLD